MLAHGNKYRAPQKRYNSDKKGYGNKYNDERDKPYRPQGRNYNRSPPPQRKGKENSQRCFIYDDEDHIARDCELRDIANTMFKQILKKLRQNNTKKKQGHAYEANSGSKSDTEDKEVDEEIATLT